MLDTIAYFITIMMFIVFFAMTWAYFSFRGDLSALNRAKDMGAKISPDKIQSTRIAGAICFVTMLVSMAWIVSFAITHW